MNIDWGPRRSSIHGQKQIPAAQPLPRHQASIWIARRFQDLGLFWTFFHDISEIICCIAEFISSTETIYSGRSYNYFATRTAIGFENGFKVQLWPCSPVSYTIIVPNLLTVRILIGPFKAYSGLLYELYLGPMMVNIRTFGTCKLNIHELAQKYQIKSNSEKIYHTELTKLKMVSLDVLWNCRWRARSSASGPSL